jgi:hypothetical protein
MAGRDSCDWIPGLVYRLLKHKNQLSTRDFQAMLSAVLLRKCDWQDYLLHTPFGVAVMFLILAHHGEPPGTEHAGRLYEALAYGSTLPRSWTLHLEAVVAVLSQPALEGCRLVEARLSAAGVQQVRVLKQLQWGGGSWQ